MKKVKCPCGREVEMELIPDTLISFDPTIEFRYLCKRCLKEKRERLFPYY